LIPDSERVVITVDDEGPGIPRSEREKVFEPFYRIGSARDPETGGVGLGLSVTRSIVWEHGGEIILGNHKGGGLSVRVELPIGGRLIPPAHEERAASGDAGKPGSVAPPD
jgi:K+-sensing histidine kinase KdpD